VNPTTPYEQLIAAKLDQVPVPDMADSIWASIEMQLDVPADAQESPDGPDTSDAPESPGSPNAHDTPAQGPASISNVVSWYGLAGLAAVVAIILWWYYSRKGHAPEKITPPPAIERTPAEPPRVAPEPPPSESPSVGPAATPIKKNVIKTNTASFHNIPHDSIHVSVDSAIKLNLPPVKVDSSSLQNNRISLPDVDLYSTPPSARPSPPPAPLTPTSTGKKHKGVKGITDDDYKISAGKDSGRKKN